MLPAGLAELKLLLPCGQVWLQEWAWTESGKHRDIAKRNKGDGSPNMDTKALEHEPMFCFETAVNMLYWSALAWDFTEGMVRKRPSAHSPEHQPGPLS